MSIEASQLITNLGGRIAAKQLLKNAPVGAEYIGQYRLMNEFITHYYDGRVRLFQDGHWVNIGAQQLANIKNNTLFTVYCELRDIHASLAELPALPVSPNKPICGQCAHNLDLLSQSQARVMRQTQESIDKCNSRYWWRVGAVISIGLNFFLVAATGQGWLL